MLLRIVNASFVIALTPPPPIFPTIDTPSSLSLVVIRWSRHLSYSPSVGVGVCRSRSLTESESVNRNLSESLSSAALVISRHRGHHTRLPEIAVTRLSTSSSRHVFMVPSSSCHLMEPAITRLLSSLSLSTCLHCFS